MPRPTCRGAAFAPVRTCRVVDFGRNCCGDDNHAGRHALPDPPRLANLRLFFGATTPTGGTVMSGPTYGSPTPPSQPGGYGQPAYGNQPPAQPSYGQAQPGYGQAQPAY